MYVKLKYICSNRDLPINTRVCICIHFLRSLVSYRDKLYSMGSDKANTMTLFGGERETVSVHVCTYVRMTVQTGICAPGNNKNGKLSVI